MNYQRKYNEVREKVTKSIKKEFHSEPAYNEKYLKTEIKAYNGQNNTNFHNNKIPKGKSQCICLLVILINSVLEHVIIIKYVVKLKKMLKYITDDKENSSDSDRKDSSEESSDAENSHEKNAHEEN